MSFFSGKEPGVDTLWAPWRMEYIRGEMQGDGCFLCRAAESEDDASVYVVRRSTVCLCLLNRYPYNNGHLLIAPYRHVGELEELSAEERADIMALLLQAKGTLDAVCAPHGFNIGLNLGQAAGAGLAAHLHLHVVPRWSGDTNCMTTLSATRVIPQALAEMRRELSEKWKEAGGC